MPFIFHIYPNRDWFSTYETTSRVSVVMENNSPCKIAGIGIVKIKIFYRSIGAFGEVRHGPDLNRNVISLSSLDSK